MSDTLQAAVDRKRFYGVYPAIVTDVADPLGLGRVRISLPWASDSGGGYELWARFAVLMAGNSRGTWFIPDVDDEVLVAFEMGDPSRPIVLGGLWNGVDAPPETMDSSGANDLKSITSRSGIKITLDDTSGRETLTLETPAGQKLTLTDGPGSVKIEDSGGNSLSLEPSGIKITGAVKVTVEATSLEVTAATVQVNAAMSTFSGVLKADTVITNSVISTSYTPGAGNLW